MTAVPIGQQSSGPQEITAAYEFKTPELGQRWERLKKLMQANAQAEQEIQAKAQQFGGRFVISPDQLFQLRFQCLIDAVFPKDTEEGQAARLDLDFAVQERLKELLVQARAGITQAALSAGSMLPPEELDRMVRAQSPGLAAPQERRSR